MRPPLGVVVLLMSLLLAGCSTDYVAGNQQASASGTTSRSIPPGLQPPAQHNDPGVPDVPFDPCLDIDDSVVARLGVDPATKRRSDTVGERTYLRCKYTGPSHFVTIMSINTTYDEQWQLAASRANEIRINGRQAFVGVNAINQDGCSLVMRTWYGVAIVDTNNAVLSRINEPPVPPCDGTPELAEIVEPVLPKER